MTSFFFLSLFFNHLFLPVVSLTQKLCLSEERAGMFSPLRTKMNMKNGESKAR